MPSIPTIPGQGPALRLYDTADRQIRPVTPGIVPTMYVCGITPYDATHLGHAATYLTFDLINRLWHDAGHQVCYVQNITDVDDPLLERAQRDGLNWTDLASSQIELFRTDMTALKVIPPTHYVAVTEVMADIIDLIEDMLTANSAYVLDSDYPDIYFRTDSTQQFGYESGYNTSTMIELSRQRGGDPDRPGKKHPLDPLLWRAARPTEPSWPAPFGQGRPGWHVECAAIMRKYINGCVDIQGGGSDLIFPHHEFSSAHIESVTQSCRCARHYVHTGMIGLDGQKMSKSLGNLVFVSQLRRQGIESSAIRLGLFAEHYRCDRYWTPQVLNEAQQRLHRWRMAMNRPAGPAAETTLARLRRYLADDLDTPKALAAIDGWVTDTLEYGGHDHHAPQLLARSVDALLGITITA